MEKNRQGTHSTKMGADSSAENAENAPIFICPSPKVLDFNEKRLHWASVVRALGDQLPICSTPQFSL